MRIYKKISTMGLMLITLLVLVSCGKKSEKEFNLETDLTALKETEFNMTEGGLETETVTEDGNPTNLSNEETETRIQTESKGTNDQIKPEQETETFPKPDIKGTYNQSLKWDGSEHVKCAEDDKQLQRNELFASVLGNRHSFVYRDAVNGGQTDINFKDGAELSMQEFNYILSLQNYIPTEFALVGLNGEENNAVIIVAEKGVGNAYFLLYEYNGNAYMSVTMGRGTRNFKTNGAYIGTDDTAVIWQTDKDSAIMKHMAYFEIIKAGDDYKTVYYIAGKKVEQIEYEQYVEKWGSSGTDCEFVPLTDKNINKYLKMK